MKPIFSLLNPVEAVLLTVVLSACPTARAQPNTPPTIEPVGIVVTDEDQPVLDLPIRLSDAESAPELLKLTVVGQGSAILPTLNILFTGTGSERFVSLYPAANSNGQAVVNLRVTDPQGAVGNLSFTVRVLSVADPPNIDAIAPFALPPGTSDFRLPLTVRDPDTPVFTVRIRATSSRTNIVPNTMLTPIWDGRQHLLRINVPPKALGSTAITIEASDGASTNTTAFVLQVRPADFTPILPSGLAGLSSPAALLDLNADGWLDVQHGATGFRLLRSGLTTLTNLSAHAVRTPFGWADYDGDGDLDALANGARVMALRYVRTDNSWPDTPSFTVVSNITLQEVGTTGGLFIGALAADLDLDGDLDAVAWRTNVPSVGRVALVLQNDGPAGFSPKLGGLAASAQPFAVGDFDGDGDNDLLLQEFDPLLRTGPLTVYANSGNGEFLPTGLQLTGTTYQLSGAGWGDLDSDGRLDIWYESLPRLQTTRELVVLTRQEAGFTERFRHSSAVPGEPYLRPVWADFDLDGHTDFVAVMQTPDNSFYRAPVLFRNDGTGRFRQSGVARPSNMVLSSPAPLLVGDLTGDGRLDFIAPAPPWVWTNNAPAVPAPPGPPAGLEAQAFGSVVGFSWDNATDLDQTAPLTYNLRVGTRSGANDIVPSMSLKDGTRLLPAPGNAGYRRWQTLFLPEVRTDKLYWSVQAVDHGFLGGPFAGEQVVVLNLPDNNPPQLSLVADQLMKVSTARTIEFTVVDDHTAPADLRVAVEASDASLFLPALLRLSTPPEQEVPGLRRTLQLEPASDRVGEATITLTVRDRAGLSSSRTFRVSVASGANGLTPRLAISRQDRVISFDVPTEDAGYWEVEVSSDLVRWRVLGEPLDIGIDGRTTVHPAMEQGAEFFRLCLTPD